MQIIIFILFYFIIVTAYFNIEKCRIIINILIIKLKLFQNIYATLQLNQIDYILEHIGSTFTYATKYFTFYNPIVYCTKL